MDRRARRCRATSASTTPAATDAFSDSTGPAIGIDTVTSQVCLTSRLSPLPSEPITSSNGSVASSKSSSDTEPSASRPATMNPAVAYSRRVRVRLVARATGSRAATPAEVRQATAVMPGRAPLRHHDPVPAERPDRADHRAEVARVGHPVQRDDQAGLGRLGGQLQQLVGVGVGVRRHLQRDALVQRTAGDPVEVAARHLQDRDAEVGREVHRLGDPLVGGRADHDVQRGGRHPGPQALQHRVAAEHRLRGLAVARPAPLAARSRAPAPGGLALRRRRARSPAGPRRARVASPWAGSGPCPPARGAAGRRSRRPCPSWCRPCGSRRAVSSCRP